MNEHTIHQVVQAYFDATLHFNLLEKDVTNLKRKGGVLIINTTDKTHLKIIQRK